MLRMNELFSGIGSQTKALQRASVDHVITGISEIDEPAIRSYTAIYGDTYNYGDISKVFINLLDKRGEAEMPLFFFLFTRNF